MMRWVFVRLHALNSHTATVAISFSKAMFCAIEINSARRKLLWSLSRSWPGWYDEQITLAFIETVIDCVTFAFAAL